MNDSISRIEDNQKELAQNQEKLLDFCHDIDKRLAIITQKMEDHFVQDSRNLESIGDSLGSIKQELGVYNQELRVHIRRTEALEEANDLLRRKLDADYQKIQERLQILEEPVIWFQFTKKAAKWIIPMIAIAAALSEVIRWLTTHR